MMIGGVSSEFVELDPTGRYGRYNEILGKGASKTVFRAFDEYDGVEVAWNQVKLYDCMKSYEDLERLNYEIHLLKTLKHSNIMNLYTSWVDTDKRNTNFVTEMFTSGTLREYRLKHRRVSIRAFKNWCRQILKGLLYLHSHDPPIIHRDLKCDNIFVNGNHGEVKIGDLGLAAILRKSHAAHCVGTPEFMAPEVYEEEYNELVDIYSFGMCLLEMVTFEYPYSECTHPAQIYKKVISGKKPEAFYKVKDPEIRQFVEKCLDTVSRRLSAWELLNDPFLLFDNHRRELTLYNDHFSSISMINGLNHDDGLTYEPFEFDKGEYGLFTYHEDDEHFENVEISIKGKKEEDDGIFLRLRIADKDGRIRNIYFPFDTESDTAMSVATEMVSELDMDDQNVTKIADMIDGEISTLLPEWKTNGSFMDHLGSNNLKVLECSNSDRAAMHGLFEEITYHTEGALVGSSESENSHLGDIWAQHDGPSDQEHQDIEKKEPESRFSRPDNHENEIRQELRWLKAKYQMQLREIKANQLGYLSKSPGFRSKLNYPEKGCTGFLNRRVGNYDRTVHKSCNTEKMAATAIKIYAGALLPQYPLHRATSLPVDAVEY